MAFWQRDDVTSMPMGNIAIFFGRVLLGSAGALLIGLALFLYEAEEGKIENALERWWVRIRDLHTRTVTREAAFVRVVTEITLKVFSLIFGQSLFGLRAVVASICYSTAGLFLAEVGMCLYFADEPANAGDPVLNAIKNKKRRETLIAWPGMENGKPVYRFDIRLQGENETVFFDM